MKLGFRLDRFRYNSVRIISNLGLYRVNRSSGRFGFDLVRFGLWVTSGQQDFRSVRIRSGHIGFRVKSGQYGFESVRFWVGSISDFGSKSVQLFLMSFRIWFRVIQFGLIGSSHFYQVYL